MFEQVMEEAMLTRIGMDKIIIKIKNRLENVNISIIFKFQNLTINRK